jgi:chemotaxis protein MotA
MDIATVLGIISAFGLVIFAISMGGGIKLFINLPSVMIVVGGTMGATMVNYPLTEVLGLLRVVKNVFFKKTMGGQDIIKLFIEF